jgi:superfamily II DNA/RNA helicase
MPVSFTDLGVDPAMTASLAERGILEAFPIQEVSIPDALAGRDVVAKAPTGSGKTIAFGVAAAARCVDAKPRRPKGLILEPTRELAGQVRDELGALMPGRERRVIAIYGGTRYGPAQAALAKGVDILVACPGRLEDLLEQGMVDLSDVEIVVVDEADRMADMGFLPSVRRLIGQAKAERQVLLFSATMGPEIESLVRQFQNDPVRHDVSESMESTGDVAHHFWRVGRDERVDATVTAVTQLGRAIVFCRTRHGADRLARQLTAAGVSSVAIHGDRSQAQREKALRTFEGGGASALVATDVAARGIHLEALPGVIHFDPPADHTDYTHRSGRTGRAGLDGVVVSMVLDDQRKKTAVLQRNLDLPVGTEAPTTLEAPDIPLPTPKVTRTLGADRPERPSRRDRTERPSRRESEARSESRGPRTGARREERSGAPSRDRDGSSNRASTRPSSHGPTDRRHQRSDRGPTGTVKFYDAERGYGFVEREGSSDLFVHASALVGAPSAALEAGQAVTFEVGQGRRGVEARNVKVVKGTPRGTRRPPRR